MSTSPNRAASPQEADQRQALNDSEKKASRQPGSYKEEATEAKIVEVPPTGPDQKPIRGLDPK